MWSSRNQHAIFSGVRSTRVRSKRSKKNMPTNGAAYVVHSVVVVAVVVVVVVVVVYNDVLAWRDSVSRVAPSNRAIPCVMAQRTTTHAPTSRVVELLLYTTYLCIGQVHETVGASTHVRHTMHPHPLENQVVLIKWIGRKSGIHYPDCRVHRCERRGAASRSVFDESGTKTLCSATADVVLAAMAFQYVQHICHFGCR